MSDTPFLRHGLLLGGKPYGQHMRDPELRARYDATYAEFPRTPVSIAEFERDMAATRPSGSPGEPTGEKS